METSPQVINETMDFNEAMTACILGKKVTRLEWDDKSEYGFVKDDRLYIHRENKDHQWILKTADIEAKDWTTLE